MDPRIVTVGVPPEKVTICDNVLFLQVKPLLYRRVGQREPLRSRSKTKGRAVSRQARIQECPVSRVREAERCESL